MTFDTEAEAVAELRKHICDSCMAGEIVFVDSSAPGGQVTERLCDPPNPADAGDLLSTPCGCEYGLSEIEGETVTAQELAENTPPS